MATDHTQSVQAAVATYSSAASAGVFWGLHLSDLGVVVSSLAAVCGVVIQLMLYLNTRKETKRGNTPLERDEPPGSSGVL